MWPPHAVKITSCLTKFLPVARVFRFQSARLASILQISELVYPGHLLSSNDASKGTYIICFSYFPYCLMCLISQRKRVDAEADSVTSTSATPARATRGSAAKAKQEAAKEPVPKQTATKASAPTKRAKAAVAE